jgi:hypothetical protein
VYYPDGTPKPSRAVVKDTIDTIRGRGIDCSSVIDDGTWVEVGTVPRTTSKPRRTKIRHGPEARGHH